MAVVGVAVERGAVVTGAPVDGGVVPVGGALVVTGGLLLVGVGVGGFVGDALVGELATVGVVSLPASFWVVGDDVEAGPPFAACAAAVELGAAVAPINAGLDPGGWDVDDVTVAELAVADASLTAGECIARIGSSGGADTTTTSSMVFTW